MENNELKLNFLKRILTDTVNDDKVYQDFFNYGYPGDKVMIETINKPIEKNREEGLDWPKRAHTMIGLKRLNNLHDMMNYIKNNKIVGDFIETGVWRGGATIFMKSFLNLYGINKKVFVCDSFEGLPRPEVDKYPIDFGDTHYQVDYLKVSLNEVQKNFKDFKLLDDSVIFLKGWFKDTLQNNQKINKISLLRFDGDMYGSTMDVLNNLYHKVEKKGVIIIIIDDYCLPNCAKAVTDFIENNKLNNNLSVVDKCGRFWFKD